MAAICPKVSKAFTLIELMLAILILTIVIAGGSFLFVGGRSQINLQKHYRVATQLAAQKLEELKADNTVSYDSIVVGETEQSLSLEDLSYSRSTRIENVGLYKKARVTVRWGQIGNEHNVSLVTFIAPK